MFSWGNDACRSVVKPGVVGSQRGSRQLTAFSDFGMRVKDPAEGTGDIFEASTDNDER